MSFYNPLMVQWLILRNVALREVCISTIRSDIKRLIQHNSTTINSVTISGNTMTGRYGFVFCLEKCHNLIKFDIKYCSSFSFTEVEQVLPSFPSLQIIDLDGCIRLRPHTITVLVQSCPYLQSINLSSLLFITDAEVQLIATSCHHLRSIDVSYTNITDLSIQTLLALDHQLSSSSHCMELIRFRRCIYVTIQSARNVFQRLIIPHLHGKVPSLQDHGVVMFTDVLGMGKGISLLSIQFSLQDFQLMDSRS